MSTPTRPAFDVDALRRAYAGRDADALLGLYAQDATIEIADALNPPSRPTRLTGRDAIAAHVQDVLSRDMSHELDVVACSDDAVAWSLRCAYPDGTRVLCAATAELRDGRIVREVGVQAWDS